MDFNYETEYKKARIRDKALSLIEMAADLSGDEDTNNHLEMLLSQTARNWAEVYDILSPKLIKKEEIR